MVTVRNEVFCGDSLTQGENASVAASYRQGGQGCYVERLGEIRAAHLRVPLLGGGYRGMWRSNGTGGLANAGSPEWSGTGSWSSLAPNRAPWDSAYSASDGSTLTYTIPTPYWSGHGGAALYWIDQSGVGNWRYRKDGGAWTNNGQTKLADDKLKKMFIPGPITSTIDIQANDGVNNVRTVIAGIEFYRFNPATTSGVIVHNLAQAGNTLSQQVAAASPDWGAWFDSVVCGSGATPHTPNQVSLMFSNDALHDDPPSFSRDLSTFYNRLAFTQRVHINPYEQGGPRLDGVATTAANQAAYRQTGKDVAANLGISVVDIYDLWAHQYGANAPADGSGYASASAAGLIYSDAIHPTQAGHIKIAGEIWWGG